MPVIALELNSDGAVIGLNQYNTAAKQAGAATDTLTKKVSSTEGGFNKMKSSSQSLLTTLSGLPVVIAAIGGALATKLISGSINAASAMEETQAKFNTVFKGMTNDAEKWAVNLNKSFGMSREESKRYLSSIQDLLVPMGMAREKAGFFSNEIVKLSADLGSFNNLPTAQVLENIHSALTGEYESMKKYGIILTATTVQQKALTMGLAETKDALTAADKAQAAYQIMLENSGDALGDFNRTQSGFANQMKIAKATITDINTTLGQILLPLVNKGLTAFNNWAKSTNGFSKQLGYAVETIRFFHNGISGLILIGDGLVASFAYIFDFLVNGFNGLLSPINWLGQALVKLGALENNPFDKLRFGAENFKQSSREVFNDQLKNIQANNAMYDSMRATIDKSTAALKNHGNTVDLVKTKSELLNKAAQFQNETTRETEAIINDAEFAGAKMDETYTNLAKTLGSNAATEAEKLTKEFDTLTQSAINASDAVSSGRSSSGSSSSGSSSSGGSYKTNNPSAVFAATAKSTLDPWDNFHASQGTNIYVNQKVSRSDIVGISNELDRYGSRS